MPNTLASEVYARSQGVQSVGPCECHYCGGPCKRHWTHDEGAGPFIRTTTNARRPGNPYVCVGCWLFKRKRTTIWFLDESFKDGQTAQNHSWWITRDKAVALKEGHCQGLKEFLLNPPEIFVLSLKTESGRDNLLHLMYVNESQGLKADTSLNFTVDQILHTYTIYELEQGLKQGPEGMSPGVGALLRFMGTPIPETKWDEPEPEPVPNIGGRPRKEVTSQYQKNRTVRKVV